MMCKQSYSKLPIKMLESSVPDEVLYRGVEPGMRSLDRLYFISTNNMQYTKSIYNELGILIVSEDDLFYKVALPVGWKIQYTDHYMWSNLLDDQDRKRASIFYKPEFYDKRAHISFDTRYTVHVSHIGDPDNYEEYILSDIRACVKDCDKIIYETEPVKSSSDFLERSRILGVLNKHVDIYMELHYPDYKNVLAYW